MHYVNGSYVNDEDAKISIFDLGLSRGYGVGDYLRTYRKKPFHLQDHLERLQFSAAAIGLSLPKSFSEIEEIIDTLLKSYPEAEASIKIVLTGNVSSHRILPDRAPNLIISVFPVISFNPSYYTIGAAVVTTSHMRALPKVKTLFYIPGILSLKNIEQDSVIEAIHLNAKNQLLEGTTSNFFCFKGDTLITPDSDDVLYGITRNVLLRVAEGHFSTECRLIDYSEIPSMDEAFIASSSKEVLPVVKIDGKTIGSGKVGERSKRLAALLKDYTSASEWPPLMIERHLALQAPQELTLETLSVLMR